LGFSEDGDVFGVSAEFFDVVGDPVQRRDLIHQTVVAEQSLGIFRGQRRMREPPGAAQAIVHGHDNHPLPGELAAVVSGARTE